MRIDTQFKSYNMMDPDDLKLEAEVTKYKQRIPRLEQKDKL